MTIEKLKITHDSCPRNKRIANVLYRRGFIEHWGGGIEEIIDLCAKFGLPEPEFIEDDNTFIVRFRAEFSARKVAQHKQDYSWLTNRQKEILSIMQQQQKVTTSELASLLTVKVTKRTIQKDLSILKKANIIAMQGTGKKTFWVLL